MAPRDPDDKDSAPDSQTHKNTAVDGDIVGGAKQIQGDEVHGDKVLGDKIIYQAPPEGKHVVEIRLRRKFSDCDQKFQEGFLSAIALLLDSGVDDIRITNIFPGSIIITLEMPTAAAKRLRELAIRGDSRLKMLQVISVKIGEEEIRLDMQERTQNQNIREQHLVRKGSIATQQRTTQFPFAPIGLALFALIVLFGLVYIGRSDIIQMILDTAIGTPTSTVTPTLTNTATNTATNTPTPTPTHTYTPTPTHTLTPTLTSTPTGTLIPDIFVLADFNDCSSINNLGGSMGTAYDNLANRIKEIYVPEGKRGCEVQLDFEIQQWAAFWIKMGAEKYRSQVDLRPYKVMSFDIRIEGAKTVPLLKVEIKQERFTTSQLVSRRLLDSAYGQRQNVHLELSGFQPFQISPIEQFSAVEEIVFVLENAYDFAQTGQVYLDNIEFWK